MNKIESKLQSEVKQDVVKPTSLTLSESDALMMVKLFSYCPEGSWIRPADFQASDSIKRIIRNWVEKGFVYYVQDQVSSQWLLVLDDKCVQRCWEVLAAADNVRMERSMRDMKKRKHHKLSPLMWVGAAGLAAVTLGLLVASVLLW